MQTVIEIPLTSCQLTMSIETWLGIALTLIVCLYIKVWLSYKRTKRTCAADIPCVQPRLPVVGNAWALYHRSNNNNNNSNNCHLVLTEWAKEYGPVYRMKLYNEEILVLNDFDSIHDALVVKGSDFAGRPAMYRTHHDGRHEHSIVWQTFTEKLQFLRKEVLRSLKLHGDGMMESFEHKCLPEIRGMLEKMGRHGTTESESECFDPRDYVYDAVSNIMLGLTLNQRFDSSNKDFQELKDINQLFNEIFGSGNARNLDFLPWLRTIRHYVYYRKLKRALRLRDEFWTRELSRLKAKGLTQCIVQRLLSLMSSDYGSANNIEEKTAKEVFTNLILAGTDTTATALTSLLLVFLHKPEVQENMWEEMHLRRLSGDQPIKLSDRRVLPYCQAVLLELLRFISHVPLAVPHSTIRDTSVLDTPVPKNMTVYINLWSLHHSDHHWHQPWTFIPERFMDVSGQIVPPSHPCRRRLMAFGAGRRVCLGEVLAKNRLFLFATSLVQRFQFLPGDQGQEKTKLPPLDPRSFDMGLVIHPPPFKLCVRPRDSPCDKNL